MTLLVRLTVSTAIVAALARPAAASADSFVNEELIRWSSDGQLWVVKIYSSDDPEQTTYRLMRRLTPGPYCFILRATREAPRTLHIHKKRKQVGIRVPHHEVALGLVRELGNPIVSTSASWEGETLNDPNDIASYFSGVDIFLDAGWGGLEPSTVLKMTDGEAEVVREGAGPIDML